MQLEKISENKIRFVLNTQDLKDNNIDMHSFMSNPIESQSLFDDMLDLAENELGFKTKNSKLIIEAIATTDGYFIFTITKILNKNNQIISIPDSNNLLTICEFKTFDDFCDFCTYLKGNTDFPIEILDSSYLYLYNHKYYLILDFEEELYTNLFKFLCYSITEFATFINNTDLFEKKLKESGKIIMRGNAVSTCLKYF